jgi:hypothetical protein
VERLILDSAGVIGVLRLSKLEDKVDGLGGEIEALTIAVARLEGSLWGRTPSEPARRPKGRASSARMSVTSLLWINLPNS